MAKPLGSENPDGIRKEIFESIKLNPEQKNIANQNAKIKEILQPHLPKNPRENSELIGDVLKEFTISKTKQKIIETTDGLFLEMSIGKIKFYQKLTGTTLEELKTKIENILTE